MWGYLRLRWWLSETSKNTTPPRAPNGTKKGRCRTKKRPIQKKAIIELHPWKIVWQNCPVSWKFWLLEVIFLTMDYCSTQPQSCSASAFLYFEVIGVNWTELGFCEGGRLVPTPRILQGHHNDQVGTDTINFWCWHWWWWSIKYGVNGGTMKDVPECQLVTAWTLTHTHTLWSAWS